MKTSTRCSLRFALLVSVALGSTDLAHANERTPSAERLLAATGRVTVERVTPYVEVGTFRIQVSTKLGQPDTRLADGTWLYHRRVVEGSNATGTVVVRFNGGRVSQLELVTPAVAAAMLKPSPASDASRVASHR